MNTQVKPDLHIISFAVPYPPLYGGAIDSWNRIRALHKEGVKIILHCFVYSAFKPHDALKEVVKEVHYYPRITWPAILAPGQPYIVSSRKNPVLLSRLKNDEVPILFDGIHTTGFTNDLKGRKLLLRAHNIEHKYYGNLARDCSRFQYLFYQREALALERYEMNNVNSFDGIFAISTPDHQWFGRQGARSTLMHVYHGFQNMNIRIGRGKYLLYQGDLSMETNQKALFDVLKNIPAEAQYPIVVAGLSGDPGFEEKLLKYPNIKREKDVSEERMAELVQNAQVILAHSRFSSGMKVKIFPALYQGRFIATNENSLTHTSLDKALHIYKNLENLGPLLEKLWPVEFSASHLDEREAILSQLPSDQEKAKEIIQNL